MCDMSTRGCVIETLLPRFNVEQTEIISSLLLTFITHKF